MRSRKWSGCDMVTDVHFCNDDGSLGMSDARREPQYVQEEVFLRVRIDGADDAPLLGTLD